MIEGDASWSGEHPGPPATRVWRQPAEGLWKRFLIAGNELASPINRGWQTGLTLM
jgi:hypothetical protein